MRPYSSPSVVDYGYVTDLTHCSGGTTTQDTGFDPNGNVIATGVGEVDADPLLSIDDCRTDEGDPPRGCLSSVRLRARS